VNQILALALALTATVSPSAAADTAEAEVKILGSTVLSQDMESEAVKATVLVHGVRRISGATVVYYSAGLPAGAEAQPWSDFNSLAYDRASKGSGGLGNVRLVDFGNEKIYAPLVRATDYGSEQALVSPSSAWPADAAGGTFYTFYAVLPELPEDVDRVDVMFGHGDVVHDLPVEEGVLEPATQQEDPLVLGDVWPLIDQTVAARSSAPEDSVRPLLNRLEEDQ
jgi:hypothetical protein